MDIKINDVNKVIEGYDNMLLQANKQLILVTAMNRELSEKIAELESKLAESENNK